MCVYVCNSSFVKIPSHSYAFMLDLTTFPQ